MSSSISLYATNSCDQGDAEGEGTDVTRKKERQGDREYDELDQDEDRIKEEIDNQVQQSITGTVKG